MHEMKLRKKRWRKEKFSLESTQYPKRYLCIYYYLCVGNFVFVTFFFYSLWIYSEGLPRLQLKLSVQLPEFQLCCVNKLSAWNRFFKCDCKAQATTMTFFFCSHLEYNFKKGKSAEIKSVSSNFIINFITLRFISFLLYSSRQSAIYLTMFSCCIVKVSILDKIFNYLWMIFPLLFCSLDSRQIKHNKKFHFPIEIKQF